MKYAFPNGSQDVISYVILIQSINLFFLLQFYLTKGAKVELEPIVLQWICKKRVPFKEKTIESIILETEQDNDDVLTHTVWSLF